MSLNSLKYCFVIPCYNHSETVTNVLRQIENYQLSCYLIDDGSNTETAKQLDIIASQFSWVKLIHLDENQGKGGAVMTGLQQALQEGFTHAIQIDADGQHNCADITLLLSASKQQPYALISGQPIYDQSVPKHRLIARYITHFWVWVETLSFCIKDSMCGFRIYPLQQSINLINKHNIGKRMDFDTDIMVRLYRDNTPSIFIPTKVIYPEDGISHFNLCKDNIKISWMHTKLFLGMLPRAITLLTRNFSKNTTQEHWSEVKERKGLWGIKFILQLYKLFGRPLARIIMFPIITYFWLTGHQQRQASKQYLKQLKQHTQSIPWIAEKNLTSFQHFHRFGESLLDKLASWQGDIKIKDLYYPNQEQGRQMVEQKKGLILIGSHLGDIEMCRALADMSHDIVINALVFTHHALRFNQILKEANPKASINLIQVNNLGPDIAILLKQKIDAGEWIAIVGDRTTTNPHQRVAKEAVVWADFLGKPAPFPKGPFILASILHCPVYLIWGLKPNGRFQFYVEPFADPLTLPRENRQQALQETIQSYAKRLEHYCLLSPLDWFNFYDFWNFSQPTQVDKKNEKQP